MTSTNSLLSRAQPSAPSTTQCVPTTVQDYTPNAEYSPDQRTDLQALYDRVSRPLGDVLAWINGHFAPSPPITTGRTAKADNSTLRAYDGSPIISTVPVTVTIPQSALGASLSNAVVFRVPLVQPAMVRGLAVINASGAPSGTGSITAGYLTAPISSTTAIGTGQQTYLTRSVLNITASTSSGWTAHSDVYVTIYLRWL